MKRLALFAVGLFLLVPACGQQPADEKASIAFLKSKGISITLSEQRGGSAALGSVPLGNAEWEHLKRIKQLNRISAATDQSLARLAELRELTVVYLSGPDITDEGIDKLAEVKTL